MIRIHGKLLKIKEKKLNSFDLECYTKEILKEKLKEYYTLGEIDASYSLKDIGRFRVNIFKEKGVDAIAIRSVSLKIPTLDDFNYPKVLKELCNKKRGLVLITGATGSGKSTTLAAMINEINKNKAMHIITLEEPIEFLHCHNKSIINQREIGVDSPSYKSALKSVLREDPDVILIGELRDYEAIATAITAAETGHLVLSTLHTIGAAKTIDRIIDVFPANQQMQIRTQLATILEGVISQQLVPTIDGKMILASEIMISNSAIRSLIREGKSYQIESIIQTSGKYRMKTMDKSLLEMYKKNLISKDTVLDYGIDKEAIEKEIN